MARFPQALPRSPGCVRAAGYPLSLLGPSEPDFRPWRILPPWVLNELGAIYSSSSYKASRMAWSTSFAMLRGSGEVDAVDVKGFNLTTGEVDVNVQWNFDVAFCDGLKEGKMRGISRSGETETSADEGMKHWEKLRLTNIDGRPPNPWSQWAQWRFCREVGWSEEKEKKSRENSVGLAGSDIVRNTPYVRHALIIQHIAKMRQIPRGGSDLRCGMTAIVAFTTLYAFSLRPIRAHAYELFFYVHLAIVLHIRTLLVCAYFHTRHDALTHWIYPCFIIWGLDHLICVPQLLVFNFGFTSKYTMNATDELLSDDFARLRLLSPSYFHWAPGQTAYLTIPSISRLPFEAHPFTIASIDSMCLRNRNHDYSD
ncbi:hypothetical protein M405DRAFT_885664 [Rhizopogon salebrosus TDB-379]|nr:hypothetical protein M405DRAFT_885664 [Rhizopogon salebrosus TDB-379]